MKRISLFLTVLSLLLVLFSCTADIPDPGEISEPSSWEDVFLLYWNTMNTEYVHFENETNLDWDAVYDKYLPLFIALDFNRQSDSLTAFAYFKEIALSITADNHYNLKIYDRFGSVLDITPSAERKWKAQNPEKDINEYPDVMWTESVTKLCSVNGTVVVQNIKSATNEEKETYKSYLKGIEGYFEVDNLTSSGYFHNNSGNAVDFASGYVGAVISTNEKKYKSSYSYMRKGESEVELSADASAISDSDAYEFWTALVESLDLEGFTYFYGLTDDGIFYFYLSSFPSVEILEFESILSPITKAETYMALSDELKVMYNRIWKGENRLYEKLKTQIDQLKGILSLLDNLRLIGSMNECILADSDIYSVNGVVMDVRSNGGGNLNFLFSLMGSFFRKETQIGYLRYKDGYSRYEYTPWAYYDLAQSYCNILADDSYKNPFYIIVNGRSASCSEVAALMVRLLPGGKIIGTTTYGATGALTDRNVYHSGEFNSKYVNIYTSTFEVVGIGKESYEVKGVTPDMRVESDGTSTDIRYSRAIEEIRKDIKGE